MLVSSKTMLDEQCFVMRSNRQAFCFINKLQMFDQQSMFDRFARVLFEELLVNFINPVTVRSCATFRPWQNDQILFVKHLEFARQGKLFCHSSTSQNNALQTFLLASSENVFYKFQTHYATNSACFYLRSNVLWCGRTFKHCLIYRCYVKFQMFDEKCLIVWQGPNKQYLSVLPRCKSLLVNQNCLAMISKISRTILFAKSRNVWRTNFRCLMNNVWSFDIQCLIS